MPKRVQAVMLVFLVRLAGLVGTSYADVITYSDGQIHSAVPTAGNPSYIIQNVTTLNVGPSVTSIPIVGMDGNAVIPALDGINASGFSTINMATGAAVFGGNQATSTPSNGFGAGGSGIAISSGSTLNATGGAVTGGNGFGVGGAAVSLTNGSANISGGTFTGGFQTNGGGGIALEAFLSSSGHVDISGGTFQGGGQTGTAASLAVRGPQTSVAISGGQFIGGISSIDPTLVGTPLSLDVRDGSNAAITGGSFVGGTSNNVQIQANLLNGAAFSFTGTNLKLATTFVSSTAIFGTLTGTLADGEAISDVVDVFGFGGLELTSSGPDLIQFSAPLSAVPEPSQLALLAVATLAAGLRISRRPRKSSSSSTDAA